MKHRGVSGRDLALGQRPADSPRVGRVAVKASEGALLRRAVVGEGEGLQLLEPDVTGAVGVEDGGGDAAELQMEISSSLEMTAGRTLRHR
jgi:hypothetical protein